MEALIGEEDETSTFTLNKDKDSYLKRKIICDINEKKGLLETKLQRLKNADKQSDNTSEPRSFQIIISKDLH